jgi:diaminohydroxyphosphoribosylaminopyrimidine deaminase/5-amino-6-(5-phosphoribosylamino)uracil reductase
MPATAQDHQYMQRALELARRGLALTAPNPAVGCVLLDQQGKIAGEGWHEYDRRDHAEIAALQDAAARGASVEGGTAYVTLEPCNYTGRTGPCSEALIAARVARVVAATVDPNPRVAGGGLQRLREAGITAEVGVCEAEARRLNEGFACWITRRRPLVLMKVAMSLDGRIAPAPGFHKTGQPYWITGEASRAEVQQMRWQADAAMVGIDTVLADDALLTDRSGLKRRRPLLRVVLDSALRLPLETKLVQTAQNDVVVFTVSADDARRRELEARGVRVVALPAEAGRVPLDLVLSTLGEEGILTLLTETGTRLNTALLAAGLVDRLRIFVSPQILGSDAAPAFRSMAHALRLPGARVERFDEDFSIDALLNDPWSEGLGTKETRDEGTKGTRE